MRKEKRKSETGRKASELAVGGNCSGYFVLPGDRWLGLLARAFLNIDVTKCVNNPRRGYNRSAPGRHHSGGETSTVLPVPLPRRVVAAHVLLPYFSPGGYVVSVTSDRNGGPAKAEGSGTAGVNGINVDLNGLSIFAIWPRERIIWPQLTKEIQRHISIR
jgi:hypothetical protein